MDDFQSLQYTPRCGLKGHGVFKGANEAQEAPEERDGKMIV